MVAKESLAEKPKSTVPIGITLGGLKNVKVAARDKMQADSIKGQGILIDEDNLKLAWLGAIALIASDKKLYGNALRECKITFTKDQITINADVVGLDFLKGERIRLLDFFKSYYHNEKINVLFELKVSDLEEQGKQVLSTREIFELMAEKNPNLRILKDQFGMDMEY